MTFFETVAEPILTRMAFACANSTQYSGLVREHALMLETLPHDQKPTNASETLTND